MKRFTKRSIIAVLGVIALLLFVAVEIGASQVVVTTPTLSSSEASASIALTYNPSDGSLLKADSDGLQRWTTATDWQSVTTPQTTNLTGVVVNPDKPATIYISGVGLGVARSDDGGNHWQTANTNLANLEVTGLALHSFQRETLYAWVKGYGVYRTEDGAATWVLMRDQGPPDTNVYGLTHSTLPGSMNTGWLYADTSTGAYLSMDCF